MDLLFKRYADPFLFLEQILHVGRFSEFVDEFLEIHNEEVKQDTFWELYLHSAFISESFNDFKERCGVNTEQPKVNLEATVKESINMLDGFVPD